MEWAILRFRICPSTDENISIRKVGIKTDNPFSFCTINSFLYPQPYGYRGYITFDTVKTCQYPIWIEFGEGQYQPTPSATSPTKGRNYQKRQFTAQKEKG